MFHPGVLLLIYESANMALEVPIVSTPNVGHKEHFADVYSRERILIIDHILTVLSNPNVGHKKHFADVYSRERILITDHILTVLSNPNVGHKKHFADVYSKLNVFALTQFDKVLIFFNFFFTFTLSSTSLPLSVR